ncbi:MAG: hypothetical protein RSE91_04155, partial [Bacilli bacterium]
LGFYVFSLFDDKKVKTIILSIVLGIILGISNSFRPIMIIFLIAIFLYYLFLIFKDKKFFKYISSFTLIVLFYFISMLIINNSISKILGYEVSNNSGWSVFVGSNRKYDGMWNIEDSSIFGTELYKEDSTPFKAHSYVKEIGIKRYKENGINNIKLFVNKASNIISYHSSYSYSEFIDFFSNNFPKSVKQTLKIYVYVMFLLGLVLNAYGSFKLIINNDGRYLPYVLFGMGLFMATLLMEGHIRYFTPLYVPLILVISLLSYHNEFNK